MGYKIGLRPGLVVPCCKSSFCDAYDIGNTVLNDIISEIKRESGVLTIVPAVSAGSLKSQLNSARIKAILKVADERGMDLTRQQIQAMSIPNTDQSVRCFAWMDYYFNLLGDDIPNADEKHLEPIPCTEIHAEYVADMTREGCEPLTYVAWGEIWTTLFPHVKVRQFKAVTGKCTHCAMLAHARSTFTLVNERAHLTECHFFHRNTVMSERMEYGKRRQHAVAVPGQAMSSIQDGMAQNHSLLPYYGNMKAMATVPQHLQGVLTHGIGLTFYRTINGRGGANLAIHTFLSELEKLTQKKGSLPPVIYHQIDGGSENTAKAFMAICELLVARRVTQKIVLTRLPVGHTHEVLNNIP